MSAWGGGGWSPREEGGWGASWSGSGWGYDGSSWWGSSSGGATSSGSAARPYPQEWVPEPSREGRGREPAKEADAVKRAQSSPPTPEAPARNDKWWLGVDAETRKKYSEEMRSWLTGIDSSFSSYFGIIEGNYDTIDQICRLYTLEDRSNGREKRLDPLFFEDNNITNLRHRTLFEKWFADKWGIPFEQPETVVQDGSAASKPTSAPAGVAAAMAESPQRSEAWRNGAGWGSGAGWSPESWRGGGSSWWPDAASSSGVGAQGWWSSDWSSGNAWK